MFRVVGFFAAILLAVWFFAGDGVSGLFGDGPVTLRPGGSPMSSGPQQPASTAPSVGDPERAAPTPASPAEPQREIIRFVTTAGTFGMVEGEDRVPPGARIVGRTVLSIRASDAEGAGAPITEAGGGRLQATSDGVSDVMVAKEMRDWQEKAREGLGQYREALNQVVRQFRSYRICDESHDCRSAWHAYEMAFLESVRLYEYLTDTLIKQCKRPRCDPRWVTGVTEKERVIWDALDSEARRAEIEFREYQQAFAESVGNKKSYEH